MKLKQQVVSLELSKRLKELDVKQDSLFYWCIYDEDWFLAYRKEGIFDTNNQISAFTVAELVEMLPKENIIFTKEKKQYRIRYEYNFKKGIRNKVNYEWIEFTNKSLANSFAEMLITIRLRRL